MLLQVVKALLVQRLARRNKQANFGSNDEKVEQIEIALDEKVEQMSNLDLRGHVQRCERLREFCYALGHHILDDDARMGREMLTHVGAADALMDMHTIAMVAAKLC